MHVLHITPYYPPTWAYGGIPRIVDGLSRAQAQQGARVTVLTTDAFDARARSGAQRVRDHHGVTVITVPNASNRAAYRHQLFLPLGARGALDAELGDAPPDVVHLHGHRHLLNNVAGSWARRRKRPYVLTANGTLHRHERKVGAKLAWDLLVSGRVPAGAARLIAVSQSDVARHRAAGFGADRVVCIPNGIDLGEFESLPARGRFRARHGLGQRPLVAYLGQVSPRKGVAHLVEAVAGAAASDGLGDAVLAVGGNDMGGMAAARRAAEVAPERVVFAGLLSGTERLDLLADADVLVYASTEEVFGLVPFEGLLCGAPVVVADDCGCGELIAQAGAGLLVQHGDVPGLRARIRTLLRDRAAATAMVQRGRRFIRDRLGFGPIAARHLDLYARVSAEWGAP